MTAPDPSPPARPESAHAGSTGSIPGPALRRPLCFFLLAAILSAAMASAAPAHSEKPLPGWMPDYLRAQFAGSQGLLSVGAGKSLLRGGIEPEIDYGYVPEWAGGIHVNILSQKTTFSPFFLDVGRDGTWYPLTFGYSAHVGLGDRYFLRGKKYSGYYWPSALHFRGFAGTRCLRRTTLLPGTRGWAGILEIGVIDSDWVDYYTNRSVRLKDILTAAVALHIYLGSAREARIHGQKQVIKS